MVVGGRGININNKHIDKIQKQQHFHYKDTTDKELSKREEKGVGQVEGHTKGTQDRTQKQKTTTLVF